MSTDPGDHVKVRVWTRIEDRMWTRLSYHVEEGLQSGEWKIPRTMATIIIREPIERQVMRQVRESVHEQLLEDLEK